MALECAGFLTGIGLDATVMVRSIALRGFDQVSLPVPYLHHLDHLVLTLLGLIVDVLFLLLQQISSLVTDYMEAYGTRFAWRSTPTRVDKLSSGALEVTWTDTQTGSQHKDTFDSLLWAVGESECVRERVCVIM